MSKPLATVFLIAILFGTLLYASWGTITALVERGNICIVEKQPDGSLGSPTCPKETP